MRVEERIRIDASPEQIWALITDPMCYTRVIYGMARFDVESDERSGLGARYSMRMHVGSASVGGLVEVVEYDQPRDMAWTSITGIDHRARWRLREQDDGSTMVAFRISYHSPGSLLGTVADYIAAPMVRSNLRESLERIKAEIEGGDMSEGETPGLVGKA